MLHNFDFNKVSVIAGGIVSGFADGEVITLDPQAEAFTEIVGADGETTRSKSANNNWLATIRLSQTSQSNDMLMGYAMADRLSNSGTFPFMIKDNNGRTVFACEKAYIKRLPTTSMGAEVANREWQIFCVNPDVFIGGN